MANKLLILFRLHDLTYGFGGNKKTLSVFLREDNTLGYSFYGGWQDSGGGYSISNLQLKESLPTISKEFYSTEELVQYIKIVLKTGVGSKDIHAVEIVNEIKDMDKNIFIISYTDNVGKTSIVAVTDNCEKWLEENNKERDEPETLETFSIELVKFYSYET